MKEKSKLSYYFILSFVSIIIIGLFFILYFSPLPDTKNPSFLNYIRNSYLIFLLMDGLSFSILLLVFGIPVISVFLLKKFDKSSLKKIFFGGTALCLIFYSIWILRIPMLDGARIFSFIFHTPIAAVYIAFLRFYTSKLENKSLNDPNFPPKFKKKLFIFLIVLGTISLIWSILLMTFYFPSCGERASYLSFSGFFPEDQYKKAVVNDCLFLKGIQSLEYNNSIISNCESINNLPGIVVCYSQHGMFSKAVSICDEDQDSPGGCYITLYNMFLDIIQKEEGYDMAKRICDGLSKLKKNDINEYYSMTSEEVEAHKNEVQEKCYSRINP